MEDCVSVDSINVVTKEAGRNANHIMLSCCVSIRYPDEEKVKYYLIDDQDVSCNQVHAHLQECVLRSPRTHITLSERIH